MQRINQTPVNNFVKGLITEAGELTFPEGASVDELNCTLDRDGSRSRRKGLEFETAFQYSSFTVNPDKAISSGRWTNAGGIPGYNLIPIQVGSKIYFFKSGTTPYSGNEQSFFIDLNDYQASPTITVDNAECQYTTISNTLVVASEAMDTIVVKYNSDADDIEVTVIDFKIRDFVWQSPSAERLTAIPTADATLARKYDTYNTGWTTGTINAYISATGNYPALTHAWYSGKNSSGNFDVGEWGKVYSGTSIIANGHFILDFFEQDRSTASTLPGFATEYEYSRFKTVATYAGRVFYSGLSSSKNANKILYSRLLVDIHGDDAAENLGSCYQVNDPTAEDFNDLLDTDGGVIVIPEAENIKKLHQFGQYLYVFADNGVWIIGGIDDKFTPTGYYVNKLSNSGIYSVGSFINVEGIPFWWSKYGIHSFSFNDQGTPTDSNISITTVQTFWNDIGVNGKNNVKSAYDPINKRIFWFYPDQDETRANNRTNIFILDVALQAFYPWKVNDSLNYRLAYLLYFDGYDSEFTEEDVTDNSLVTVTNDALEDVTIEVTSSILDADTQLVALVYGESESKITFATFSDDTFQDWGEDYFDSYAEAGYNFFGDLTLKKSTPYITTYCRSTETGFTGNESIGYTPINESSLMVKAYWDFKTSPSSTQEVYRIKPIPIVNSLDLTDNGQDRTVVTSRVKVRGSGRSMRLRFESSDGKDFNLLGYSIVNGSNARY